LPWYQWPYCCQNYLNCLKSSNFIRQNISINLVVWGKCKPGGLNSRDELLKPVEIFLTVETNFFFVSVKIFKIKTFQSRLCVVEIFVEIDEIVETNQDLSRNLDIMETFWVWKWQKVLPNWEISTRTMQKSTYFSIEIETNCQEMTKFPGLNEFLDLDRDFKVWTLMSRQNWEMLISVKISRLSRQTFWKCQDFLNCRDEQFDDVETETLDQDHVKTNGDPQA
jgi:hypothetical protein